MIASVLHVQIFELYKSHKFFKQFLFHLNCLLLRTEIIYLSFHLLLIKKTPDKFPRPREIDLLFPASDPSAGCCQLQLCALHLGFALVHSLELEQDFPHRPDLRAALRGCGGMERRNSQGLCFL